MEVQGRPRPIERAEAAVPSLADAAVPSLAVSSRADAEPSRRQTAPAARCYSRRWPARAFFMPGEPSIYDLVLLLSMSATEERRAKLLSDVESAIAAGGGTLERKDRWGARAMTYQIDHQSEAEYHLLQFAGPPPLLDSLSHSLRIADGVLRFRIIKVLLGTPPPPDSPPPVIGGAAAAQAPAVAEPASSA